YAADNARSRSWTTARRTNSHGARCTYWTSTTAIFFTRIARSSAPASLTRRSMARKSTTPPAPIPWKLKSSRTDMTTATLTRDESRTDLYPSRGGLQSNIVPRKHPVVWADDTRQPTVERALIVQDELYGVLVLLDVFSPQEVANLQAELDRLRAEAQSLHRPKGITEKGSRQVRS